MSLDEYLKARRKKNADRKFKNCEKYKFQQIGYIRH